MAASGLTPATAVIAGIALAAALSMPLTALEQSATVTKSFTLSAVDGRRTLVVNNVMGEIEIAAGTGSIVTLILKETFKAKSAEEMTRARQEVALEVTEHPGRLELVQGGPWRCRDGRHDGESRSSRGDCCCNHTDRDYEVRFDWTLTVPRELDLEVENVNDGAIRITGTVGRLEVGHVNDDITLENVAGQVDARTVNGALRVSFAASPAGNCRFGTVNGDIDLAFPKGLGAELSFATLNGEVYTDFPFEMAKLPATSARSTAGGRHHHELGKTTAATIGGGGIGLACNTVNGDIYIRERS